MKNTRIISLTIVFVMVLGSFGAVGMQVSSSNNGEDLDTEIVDDDEIFSPLFFGGDRKALIVGVADYPPAGPGGPDLNYPDDDAYDMRDVLIDGGWSSSDITVFIDDQGTESAITNKLNNIASGTTSSSISLFFFSGHGTQGVSGEAICCYDSDMYDYELNSILDGFNGKVVVIIDSCHSGGMGPDGKCIDVVEFTTNFIGTVGGGNENRVILMACAADEYSYETGALQNGVFTYFVVEGLEGPADANNDDVITAEETFDYAEPKTINYEPSQHPQLYDGDPSHDVSVIGDSGGDYVEETCYGIDYSDYSGDVQPHGAHAVRLSEGSGDATVWYEFNIWSDELLEVGIEFCDWGWFGDGPNLYAKNFNTGNFDLLGENMGNQEELVWKWKATSNPSNYVSSNGKVEIKVYAEEDGFLSGDDTVLDEVGIRYTPKPRVPDLDCDGSINGGQVKPGTRITGSFTVKNIGDEGSLLDWKVDSYPSWGSSWSFTPSSGNDLPAGSSKTVQVSFYAPDYEDSFSGSIKVVNKEDSGDSDTVPVSVTTPKSHARPLFFNILELLQARFPQIFRFINSSPLFKT